MKTITGMDLHQEGQAIRAVVVGKWTPFSEAFFNTRLGTPWVDLSEPPANARILVSRNKREGRYLGWRHCGRISWFNGRSSKSGHQRTGRTA